MPHYSVSNLFFFFSFFLEGNLKRAVEAEVMLNCNANVIPRLSSRGKCQLLRAKAIGKAECVNLTKGENWGRGDLNWA